MVSEQKVRMMIRLAEYESHEGKQDFCKLHFCKILIEYARTDLRIIF